jgi:hypothetical protein
MRRSIYAKTSKPHGQKASASSIELTSDRPIGLSPITQERSAEFSLQLETMRIWFAFQASSRSRQVTTIDSKTVAYYLLLNFLGFIRVAKKGIPAPTVETPMTLITASLWCLKWPPEEGELGYSLLLGQASLLKRLLENEQIDMVTFKREWPKWMKSVYGWFGSYGLFREPAFASLSQELDGF